MAGSHKVVADEGDKTTNGNVFLTMTLPKNSSHCTSYNADIKKFWVQHIRGDANLLMGIKKMYIKGGSFKSFNLRNPTKD